MTVPYEEQATPLHDQVLGRTLRDGEYHIQRILGQGRMGKVYLAVHCTLSIPLALKQIPVDQPVPESVIAELDYILHGGDLTRRAASSGIKSKNNTFPSSGGQYTDHFLREALLLARLQHPAIPTLYDYFFEEGYWYIVMDYIPGRTLDFYLQKSGPLHPLEALDYAIQLCDVLDYLHKQEPPLAFRDLKPANILRTPASRLMLIDFGIACYSGAQHENSSSDCGSPEYAAPEQFQEHNPADTRSDLYSLGIILYEMLSGKKPLASEAENSGHFPCAIEDELDISMTLNSLIKLATRVDPTYRYQSAHTLYLALERAYHVEEQLHYQRRLLKALDQAPQDEHTKAGRDIKEPNEDTHPLLIPHTLDLEQRRLTRESLLRARLERIEQERLEIQFASVDESLSRRSSMSLSLQGLALPDEPIFQRSVTGLHRPIQISFMLALILFLVMASLLVYARVTTHIESNTDTITQPAKISTQNVQRPTTENYWQTLPSLPTAEADNTAIYVELQGRPYIYMTGGYRSMGKPSYDRALYRYDINSAHWETVMDSHFPGMVNNASTVDEAENIFFTAGYSSDTLSVSSALYIYQAAKNKLQKVTPPDQIQLGFAGAMLADKQGHIYITQGFLKAGDAHTQAGTGWYRYDIANQSWHELQPLPAGLGYVILALGNDGAIFLIGGSNDAGQQDQSSKIYRYDASSNTWSQSPDSSPQTFSAAASCTVWPNKVIIIGGYDAAHGRGSNSTWLFDLHTLHWRQLNSFTQGNTVLGAAACNGSGHAYLVRGTDNPKQPTRDFWETIVSSSLKADQ